MAQSKSLTREPGLAEALRRRLDPDEWVKSFAVNWMENGTWHSAHFADSWSANEYVATVPGPNRYVVGTSAMRRHVHPPQPTGSLAVARRHIADAKTCIAAGQDEQAHLCMDLAELELEALERETN